MSGTQERKIKKTKELAKGIEILESRTRDHKKPVKDPDYDYTSLLSDYDEREERLLKRVGKLNRKQKDKLLLNASKSQRASLNPPPKLSYQEAFEEILHQSHMLKQQGNPGLKPITKGEARFVKNAANYLKNDMKGVHLQGIMIDLVHHDDNLEVLKSIVIPRRIMPDGMIFIATENVNVAEVLAHFEAQEFRYAENIVIVPLKKSYVAGRSSHSPCKKRVPINTVSNSINIDKALQVGPKNQFCKAVSHTLIMMRRWGPHQKSTIVIQHQRTCDTCFYVYGKKTSLQDGVESYPWKYLYRNVETLLPKCSREGKNQFVHLWAPDDELRDGWVKVVQKK